MGKIAIISDLHFGKKKNSEIMLESQSKFFYNQLFPYLRTNDIKDIIVLGDIFDSRDLINVKIMNEVYKLFTNDFQFHVIVGNHDLYHTNSNDITSLKFLHKFSNVLLYSDIIEINFWGKKILFVPWIIDDIEFSKSIDSYSSDYVMCHADINGFYMTKEKVSDNQSLSPSSFDNFSKIFSGHFHSYQSKLFNNTLITYIGSPYQLNRGDIGDKRGFIILDTNSNTFEFIENNKSSKFIKLEYPTEIIESELENNFVDIIVDEKLLGDDVNKYLDKINKIKLADECHIIVRKDESYLDDTIQLNIESKSIQEILNDYVDIQDTVEDKKSVITILEQLYNDVRGEE